MKDFPLNDLLSATELDRIRAALVAIFQHLRKIRSTRYPLTRCLRLVEAISRDLLGQMLKVLSTRRLVHISMVEFDKLMSSCQEVFTCWDDNYENLLGTLRDLAKKKRDGESGSKLVWKINPQHKKLQTRLETMRRFRRQHEQLRTVIGRVLGGPKDPTAAKPVMEAGAGDAVVPAQTEQPAEGGGGDANAVDEVTLAYENVKEVEGLDLSEEGTKAWDAALRRYEERIERVEARITARLRDQLGSAKNANEMFRIFSRFNALFVRPHIRHAIREYQTQLIQRVKEDIEALQKQFTGQYQKSPAANMSRQVDLPPVSSSIIWIRQIHRQLRMYLKRVEDVLGKDWAKDIEGQQLKKEGDNFMLKLDTTPMFEEWVSRVQTRNLQVQGRIYSINTQRSGVDGKPLLKLRVNFLPEIITLSKEVRNLKSMGFRVPLSIVNKAHQANGLYPFAISLIESIRTYDAINERIAAKKDANILVAGAKKEIQEILKEGMMLVWESYKLDPYVKKLAESMSKFAEATEELLQVQEQVELQLAALDSCQYSTATIGAILGTVQKAIDSLSLHQFSNLDKWVERLDKDIEAKLAWRLQEGIKAWTAALEGRDLEADDTDHDDARPKAGGEPKIQKLVHEMRLTQQVMYLLPSVEEARMGLMGQMFAWQAVVTEQPRISATRFNITGLEPKTGETTYRKTLSKLPEGQGALDAAYGAMERMIAEVQAYVAEWLRYQALWDLQGDALYEKLKGDLERWMKTLIDIKKARSTFDTSETRKEIGAVIIDYAKVQSKVSLKYDSWHKDVLAKFGTELGGEMSSFHSGLSKARGDLESQSVDAATTSEAVGFITYVQGLKRSALEWGEKVEAFREGQRLLERQRFQFPQGWLYADNVDGEWDAFSDILSRKDANIQAQVSNLQDKIRAEDKAMETRTTDLLTSWESSKPTEGKMRPENAMAALSAFEGKLAKLKEERDNLGKAKDALELADPAHPSPHAEKLSVALEELADLKGVWEALQPVYGELDELKEKPWLSVQPRKLRQGLDGLLTSLKELPAKYRTYDGYEHVKRLLQSYTKVNMLVVELKSEALKERHWKTLQKRLRVNWNLNDLTLGAVWDAGLERYEGEIRDVILVAQGEMALEEFLKQVREAWGEYELDLVSYQNKTRLIRGWDDLFNKLKEHINSLGAMRLSPYYKEFEEDALAWEERLTASTLSSTSGSTSSGAGSTSRASSAAVPTSRLSFRSRPVASDPFPPSSSAS